MVKQNLILLLDLINILQSEEYIVRKYTGFMVSMYVRSIHVFSSNYQLQL